MGRTVYAEERLHNYLMSLAKPNEYTIGLILGQTAGQKDYIVHLAKTPLPVGKNVVEETLITSKPNAQQKDVESCIKSVKDINESWVADHAKHVTRMLPGGMQVLGAFIVGPDDTINDNMNIQKLRSILMAIHKNLAQNKYLCGNNNEEQLILNLNSVSQNYTCKSVEINKSGTVKPAEWKFQGKATKWHQLESVIDFDRLFLIDANKDPETLKKQLQDILKSMSDIIESSLIAIEGEVKSLDDTLEVITKDKKEEKGCKNNEKNTNDKPIQISLYTPCQVNNTSFNVRITPCNASIRLVGQLVSRTFVHQKANINEANIAVKEDIIRSLASRLEMHWDSLIDEENGFPEENITLHEPPRRVLIALPESKVTLSDYLFPGEGPLEALLSLQELLDLEVHESNVQKDIELQADPIEFYSQSDVDIKADFGKDSCDNQQSRVYITGISIAVIILIIAILIHKFN
ncbi:protein odr-4 homolog isoform X1 [Megalopta genalis]|uniref:protein odr-4 homolog isoform X1 n=1 Tax=Megalopta genalis TaxID=115081 RepID=UPI001443361D|nr:protein odr-4 homolog isoform X1 [Megalopta genalis]